MRSNPPLAESSPSKQLSNFAINTPSALRSPAVAIICLTLIIGLVILIGVTLDETVRRIAARRRAMKSGQN